MLGDSFGHHCARRGVAGQTLAGGAEGANPPPLPGPGRCVACALQRRHGRRDVKNAQSQPDDIRAAAAGIAPAVRALEEAFREVMPFTRKRDIGLMASYVGMVRGIMQSDQRP